MATEQKDVLVYGLGAYVVNLMGQASLALTPP